MAWFAEARLQGIREIRKDTPGPEKGYDNVVDEGATTRLALQFCSALHMGTIDGNTVEPVSYTITKS